MRKRSLTLPTRLALAVAALLVAVMLVAGLLAMRELRGRLFHLVSANLSDMIAHLAESVDADLKAMLDLIAKEAEELAGADAESMAQFLRLRSRELAFVFDRGVIAVDGEGKVLADSLGRNGWDQVNLAEYEFFQRTFVRQTGLASEPFPLPLPNLPAERHPPVTMFTARLLNADGQMLGVLAGGVDLSRNRLFRLITEVGVGATGQVGVFTRDGMVVAHSNPKLILQRFENPLPEGSVVPGQVTEIRLADGTEALLSVRELPSVGWIAAGVFSSRDVFSPVEKGFDAAGRWFGLGLGLCCLLTWLLSWYLVRDLDRLAGEVKRIDQIGDRVGKNYQGEVGAVARSVNGMLDSLEMARREIGDLSLRLADAGERERRAIAEDLHDSVCQNLALANMRLGGMKKKLEGTREGGTVLEVRGILEEAVGEIRSLVFHLSPGILYELGLAAALEWQAGEFARKNAIPVQFQAEGDFIGMPEGEAIFLYRAVGELLANVAKHAAAERAGLELMRQADGWVRVSVWDDGRGIVSTAKDADFNQSEGGGFGLRNLRERARQFGGGVQVGVGEGGRGTRVEVRVPFVGGAAGNIGGSS